MTADDLAALNLPPPWREVTLPAFLAAELAREVALEHPLAGRQVVALAHRDDNGEVLFHLPGYRFPLAVVQLTWSGREELPPIPQTTFYRDLHAWREARGEPAE